MHLSLTRHHAFNVGSHMTPRFVLAWLLSIPADTPITMHGDAQLTSVSGRQPPNICPSFDRHCIAPRFPLLIMIVWCGTVARIIQRLSGLNPWQLYPTHMLYILSPRSARQDTPQKPTISSRSSSNMSGIRSTPVIDIPSPLAGEIASAERSVEQTVGAYLLGTFFSLPFVSLSGHS